jgi:hypothetical protein
MDSRGRLSPHKPSGLKPFLFFTLNAALKRRSSTYAFGFCGAKAPLFHLRAFGFVRR